MSFRSAHIGLAVAISLMGLGWVAVGRNPTDVELQLIFWTATAIGAIVLWRVEFGGGRRQHRR